MGHQWGGPSQRDSPPAVQKLSARQKCGPMVTRSSSLSRKSRDLPIYGNLPFSKYQQIIPLWGIKTYLLIENKLPVWTSSLEPSAPGLRSNNSCSAVLGSFFPDTILGHPCTPAWCTSSENSSMFRWQCSWVIGFLNRCPFLKGKGDVFIIGTYVGPKLDTNL